LFFLPSPVSIPFRISPLGVLPTPGAADDTDECQGTEAQAGDIEEGLHRTLLRLLVAEEMIVVIDLAI